MKSNEKNSERRLAPKEESQGSLPLAEEIDRQAGSASILASFSQLFDDSIPANSCSDRASPGLAERWLIAR
jgi:hypothetical protein